MGEKRVIYKDEPRYESKSISGELRLRFGACSADDVVNVLLHNGYTLCLHLEEVFEEYGTVKRDELVIEYEKGVV